MSVAGAIGLKFPSDKANSITDARASDIPSHRVSPGGRTSAHSNAAIISSTAGAPM